MDGCTPIHSVDDIITSVLTSSPPKVLYVTFLYAGCFNKFPPNNKRVPIFLCSKNSINDFRVNGADGFTVIANPNQDGSLPLGLTMKRKYFLYLSNPSRRSCQLC